MRGTCEDDLAALGWLLDRRRVRDCFISLDPTGASVTVVEGACAVGTRFYRLGRLSRLASVVGRRPRAGLPALSHSPRQSLLRLAGRALDDQRCRAAFIVIYDDLLLIDDDRCAPVIVAPAGRAASVPARAGA
jgi:hypothetical protein